ncbi:hypothetical protein, partial [Salmonella enterica]|uniref:hypothetical protein n=1 Tax=Salmonella enterica TaxID=28901 RepID=UPI0020C25413
MITVGIEMVHRFIAMLVVGSQRINWMIICYDSVIRPDKSLWLGILLLFQATTFSLLPSMVTVFLS